MITACLLHDVGHLINVDAPAVIDRSEDAEHEPRAQAYLAAWLMMRCCNRPAGMSTASVI